MEIIVYTDGSCSAKTGLGGIGVYMYYMQNGKRTESVISKGFKDTKTGRMEISALIHALAHIEEHRRKSVKLTIYSDSQYVVNSVNKKWLQRWEFEDGGLAGRTNGDMWQHFLKVYATYPVGNIKLYWVRGHSGVEGNEIADMLAGDGFRSGVYEKDFPIKCV